jgi:hypothetical protein
VTYVSLTAAVCTLSGSTATFIATGTCTIQANQAGNAAYAAATPVSVSFAVFQPAVQYFYDAGGNVIRIQRN